MYALDTNICIDFLKGVYLSIADMLGSLKPADIKIPAMVKAELLLGVEKSQRREENLVLYERFLEPFEVLPFNDEAAQHYAHIRAELEKSGIPVGPNDLVIASTVMAHQAILVTHNIREYSRIQNLHLEDWTGAS